MRQTLLISALLCLGTISSPAQAPAAKLLVKALAAPAAPKAATKLPKHSTTFDYDGTNNQYRYESDYTYNPTGTLATEVQRSKTTPLTRITNTYDPEATDFLTLTTEATYNATTQTWGEEQPTYRYDITRNTDGQITHMVAYDFDEDPSGTPETTVGITYDTGGTPNVVTLTMDADLTGEVEITLSDLKWTEAGSQQMAEMGSLFALISGGRQIQSATMGLSLMGLPLSGPLTVSYADNGNITANVSLGYIGTPYMTLTILQTTTDANGSYQLDVAFSGMVQNMYSRTAVTMDDHGNVTRTDEYEGSTAADLEKTDSERTDYTYADYASVTTVVSYSWDEADDTYTPYLKVVYDEFTTGIEGIHGAVSAPSERVFGLDGQLLGQSAESLPSGLYIVQKGNKAVKFLKR